MKWTLRTALELVAILAMMAAVFVLAVLQYRWTAEISSTEQERQKATLAANVRNFTQEFSYDFQRLCESLEIDPETSSSEFEILAQQQLSNWAKAASDADLIAGLYIWRTVILSILLRTE